LHEFCHVFKVTFGVKQEVRWISFLLNARVLFVSEFKKKQPGNGNADETAGSYSLNLQKKCFGHKKKAFSFSKLYLEFVR